MVRRDVKWLSFFIFIAILSLFRGWSIIKHFHLSAFTVLAIFIYALYSYIRISSFVSKIELNNKFIVFLRLKRFVLFFKQGTKLTILERNIIFFSVYIPCLLVMYL
ncbi:hypothetical protein FJ875_01360, partial [Salmonella enterica]|nr:hypothetical protein [Salmonella enterica]